MKIADARKLYTKTPAQHRILLYDIETTPHLSYHWKCWDENIGAEQMVEPSRILCYAAKWLGGDLVAFGSGGTNDVGVCEELHKLFEAADIIVAHNGRAFDDKVCATRFLANGMPPPLPGRTVDTCDLAKKAFRFPHNSLNGLAKYLGIGQKVEHEGFALWVKVMAGDKAAWKRMQEYNIQDLMLLEEVYLKLRAWDKKHPNVALLNGGSAEGRCVVCGSTALQHEEREIGLVAHTYEMFRCSSCGKVMRSGKPLGRDEDGPGVMRNVV